MDKNTNWQVVVTNQINGGHDREQIVDKLAALFKTDPAKMAAIFNKDRTVIKDNIDEATARKYLAAISSTGADCLIVNTAEDDELPAIFEPIKPQPDKVDEGLIQRPTPTTQRPRDPELAMVEKQEQQKKDTHEKLSSYEKINSELYCPECGTIRSSADAICLHCNYTPSQPSKNTSKFGFIAITSIAFICIIGITSYLGWPYYQQFTLPSRINTAMQLAFDTRNHITQFILKTNFWPNQNLDANLPAQISNDIIANIEIIDNGKFVVTLHEHILNKPQQTIIFKPNLLKGKLVWNCLSGTLDYVYRPEQCRSAAP